MSTEVFTTGFPRSGSTWTVRLLCGIFSAVHQDTLEMEPLNHHGGVPDPEYVVRKTHWFRDQVVVGGYLDGPTFLVWVFRDPRDMVVSMMHYRRADELAPVISSIRDKVLDSGRHVGFGNYVRGWMDDPPDFRIRYEDLHERQELVLRTIYHGVTGEELGEERLRATMAGNQFDRLKDRHPHSMRKGIVGDWREHFTREDAELMEEIHGQTIRELGYELDGSWVNSVK